MELTIAATGLKLGMPFIATLIASIVSVVLWFLIRKKKEQIWLPIVKLFDKEQVPLPKRRFTPPPLLPFIAFLLMALLVLLLSAQPVQWKAAAEAQHQAKYHVLVDMSPSVSAHLSLEEYRKVVGDLFAELLGKVHVTASYTNSTAIKNIANSESAANFVDTLEFQRSGVRLGAFIQQQLPELSDLDQLIIVSDSDSHSWMDLAWDKLNQKINVKRLSVMGKGASKQNYFFDKVVDSSVAAASNMSMDVSLRRVSSRLEEETLLIKVASENGTNLATSEVVFPAQSNRLNVTLSWPKPESQLQRLIFTMTPERDDLLSDNLYYQTVRAGVNRVLLIAPASGERFLDDPMYALTRALEVLGFTVDRKDLLTSGERDSGKYQFVIVAGGIGLGEQHFCPRLNGGTGEKTKVWLMPLTMSTEYSELCSCVADLLNVHDAKFCEDAQSRDQYLAALQALGLKQVGGQIGQVDSGVAFRSNIADAPLDLLAFTLSFAASSSAGISVVHLPKVVRVLMQIQGIIARDPGQDVKIVDVARPDDVLRLPLDVTLDQINEGQQMINVPVAESMLAIRELDALPPLWTPKDLFSATSASAQNRRTDYKFLYRIIPAFLCLIFILELVSLLNSILSGRSKSRRASLLVFLLLGAWILQLPESQAQEINVFMLGDSSQVQGLDQLKSDVEARTSLRLGSKITHGSEFNALAAEQGWLWVRNLRSISQKDGKLLPKVQQWVMRGGFLIIEQFVDEARLEKLTASIADTSRGNLWGVIPPDHELMRSYHLLDALPICNQGGWRGMQVDGRLAIIAIPFNFLDMLLDKPRSANCASSAAKEQNIRTFINLLMVVLTTDYKRDQIHLPEILKRLR